MDLSEPINPVPTGPVPHPNPNAVEAHRVAGGVWVTTPLGWTKPQPPFPGQARGANPGLWAEIPLGLPNWLPIQSMKGP